MPSKMRSTTRPALGSLTRKTLSAAIASVLLFSGAHAAGLGKLTVLSALGQPLRAEIELTSMPGDEPGTLVPKLASVEAFRQANVDFNSALMSLRFAIEQRDGREVIRVTSTQPLNEPFIDMLLELSGPHSRLIREYTFLLDPPGLRAVQSAQVAPAAVPGRNGITRQPDQASSSTARMQPNQGKSAAPEPKRGTPDMAAANDNGGEYRVRHGDTLAGIAMQNKASGISLDQMLVALLRANPDAFVGKNMNRLKAGEILTVPNADTARAVDATEARHIVVAQAVDFNAYRSRLAGHVAAEAPRKSAESTQSAGGKITAKVEEKASAADESKDKLKLSGAMAAPGAGSDQSATTGARAADRIASEKAIAEANARVKELEKNVSDLQKILELKNKSLAERQNEAEVKPAMPAVKSDTTRVMPPQTAKPAAPVVAKRTPPTPMPASEPSFIDDLTGNPLVLPGLGILLVALGALGIFSARRKKQSKQFEDSIITDSSLKANSLFGSTGGQSVDTNNSVFNSNFAPSASQLDTNEVDPVAEADVYIAYGRDAQAEEILKEALRTQPDRHAVRVKLLEIYSNRKDLRAFEVLATELYGLTRGEGDEWAQAATLGAAIDPNNPLYADGKTAKTPDTGATTLVAPTQPLDEQGLATLLATTQSDDSHETTLNALETNTSYFSNTALTAETPMHPLEDSTASETQLEPELESESESESTKAPLNDLDFDLDGMMQDVEVPNTIPRPAPTEPAANLASIDFDFLDEQDGGSVAKQEIDAEPEAPVLPDVDKESEAEQHDMSLDAGTSDHAVSAESEVPALPDIPEAPVDEETQSAASDPLDFDLSGISLELNPAASGALPDLEFSAHDELSPGTPDAELSSVDAEMATKLDLAVAYQEIGDKEGARELLDEVLKGGTAAQSERAKALLHELA